MTIYRVYGGRDVTRTITATGETFEHLSASDRGATPAPVGHRMTSAAVPAADGITTVNPATGKALHTYPASGDAGIDAAIARVGRGAARDSARLDLDARGAVLTRAAAVLRRRVAALALLITREMGKPLTESRAEVEKCAWACEYYAEHAAELPGRRTRCHRRGPPSWISYEPVGIVLGIMPWNFPFWQVSVAAPLMAGNGALLKHSPNTTGTATGLELSWLRPAPLRTVLGPTGR